MKKEWLVKTLAIGIILLFIGFSIISGTGGNTEIKNNQLPKEMHANFTLSDGLLAYWKSDECNGTTLWDCSGHNYNGTIYGASWTPGCCLVFDGIDDYVDFDNHSENLGYNKTDDYIISVWFKSTSSSTGTIYGMSHTDSAKAFAYLDLNANGTLSYRTGNETCELAVFSDGTYNDGCWHYVEVKFLGDPVNPTLKMYVDVILEGNITDWLNPYFSEDFKTAKMGRRSTTTTNYFDGIIDQVKIYKYTWGNSPPSAKFTWTPPIPEPNEMLLFNASKSVDYDGNIILYEWDWNNDGEYDENHTNQTATFIFKEVGYYPVTLRITDNDNLTDSKTKTVSVGNRPPRAPKIDGSTNGKVGLEYEYNFSLSDLDDDSMYLRIDWENRTPGPWQGPYDSGTTVELNHTWLKKGTFIIRAQAKDIYGMESEWSTFKVIIPRTRVSYYSSLFFRFLEQFPNAFPILKYVLGGKKH